MVIEKNFFPDKRDGVLVECGAGDGLTESCGKFFQERGWNCINIEPDAENFRRLECYRDGDRDFNWNIALTDHDGTGLEEFVRGPKAHQKTVSYCWTWRSFVDQYGIVPVDLFVLDVEGHELKVIEGMRGAAVLPGVICAEYPWPTTGLEPLKEALGGLGYHFHFVSFNNAFFSREPRSGPFFGETRVYGPGELG
jgi:hypothetical protein